MQATALQAPARAAARSCLHCGQLVPAGVAGDYCCDGCQAVAALLGAEGLERYYDLRGGRSAPVGAAPARRAHMWLEGLGGPADAAVRRVALDVQGVHCTGCVWLIEELFRRQPDALQIVVNPALGSIELHAGPGFPLAGFVEAVERFGYQLGPARKQAEARDGDLLLRMGICLALAGNAMILAAAGYFGLSDGPIHQLFSSAGWAMAALSVLVGGPVFFRSAWQGLRQRVLHLDAPISVGILFAFAGSSWAMVSGSAAQTYFDTVSVFIALMLVGRVVQERVLAANRRRLLADDGARSLLCRRLREGRVEVVPCSAIAAGDELLVSPGDLVPVEATLAEVAEAELSLDWISGESAPRRFGRGETIPAGASLAGRSPVRLLAAQPFAASELVALLRSPVRGRGAEPGAHAGTLARQIAGVYVVAVLLLAGIGLAAWTAAGQGARGLEVATAILVVTCPCAFGIALPLGHELVQASLRRQGLFVRTSDFLDRARAVRRVVFDKTGTLTQGRLELRDPAALDALDAADRAALYDLAARSTHPRSQAVRRALEGAGAPALRDGVFVVEHAGIGLEAEIDGRRYRLGAPAWVAGRGEIRPGAELAFGVDGEVQAWLVTDEELRPDAAGELAALARAGHEVWILSGDEPARVAAAAAELGVAPERALGGMRPEDKAAWLAERDRGDTLFVGDGINDSLAAGAAHVVGTPAIDRPFMATRSDFYITTPGLAPIGRALEAAHRLSRVARRNLLFTTGYNAGAVALALAGLMQPWLAAVLMPLSSLAVVTMTVHALSDRRRPWRS